MSKKPTPIQVRPCKAIVVSGVNLVEGDAFVVHRIVDTSCDISQAADIPFSPYGKVLRIDETHNPVIIDMPGRYRIYPDSVVSENAELWFDEVDTCEQ